MLGIIPVGLMSNYMMIFDAISSLTNKVFNSITASIGNLVVNESKEHSEQIFYNILFANFWFISLCTVCLFTCVQTFVGLWLGKDYVLSIDVLIALCGCFYFSGMRRSALQFRSALGLFWYDRYKPVVESILNIVVSIVFIKLIGMAGVKFGTIVSTILTSFWIEGYILYKHYFDKSVKIYFAKQFLYFLLMIFECYFLYFLFGYLKFDSLLFELFVRGIISFFVVNLLYLLLFKNRKEFKYFTGLFIRKNK